MKAEMQDDGTIVLKPESGAEAVALALLCGAGGLVTVVDMSGYPGAASLSIPSLAQQEGT